MDSSSLIRTILPSKYHPSQTQRIPTRLLIPSDPHFPLRTTFLPSTIIDVLHLLRRLLLHSQQCFSVRVADPPKDVPERTEGEAEDVAQWVADEGEGT
jgi:hypothetical protein